ncbi:hypothetical protein HS088_TW06G01288 [Tripterygium wilfordii]|uniref:Uncharacterized protein n=1 Tax=Tripterygium wilfordii TaxID=458696 RepID=A0A7J7DL97_TRIWF|nr:hypothetical protein HS088_TW06G01288 [Tripterygium wilfordii]
MRMSLCSSMVGRVLSELGEVTLANPRKPRRHFVTSIRPIHQDRSNSRRHFVTPRISSEAGHGLLVWTWPVMMSRDPDTALPEDVNIFHYSLYHSCKMIKQLESQWVVLLNSIVVVIPDIGAGTGCRTYLNLVKSLAHLHLAAGCSGRFVGVLVATVHGTIGCGLCRMVLSAGAVIFGPQWLAVSSKIVGISLNLGFKSRNTFPALFNGVC